jgi:DNA helicase-2/ATP-dependent DNA helicase PcrA
MPKNQNQTRETEDNLLKTHKKQVFPLNPEQKRAAEAPSSPLLIVAGAGTGKTRTLTSRIVYLIEQGIAPERICAITFTNKAAQEMSDRMGAMHNTKPYIGTFHSLGARILRKECRVFGREPNFAIFDDHDSFDLLKKAVKTVLASKKNTKEVPTAFARKISRMKNLNIPEEDPQVVRVFELYEDALKRNNAFDFDDLIAKPVEMFKTHPELLKKYQSQFDAILVDEYQDINPKQYEFVKFLAGGHKNITVVGDDEQTIYTWRYADIKIFLDFDKDWPNAAIHFLEENYRSTGNIIEGASAVVQNNRFRTPKKLWTKEAAGEPITIYEAWGENEEGAWIAQTIKKIESINPKTTIAVLYRTNAQSRAIEQALIRENISYKIFGGLKFYERREIKDAVAALRYASNQYDEVSRERLEKNLTKKKFAEFKSALLQSKEWKPADVIKLFFTTFNYFEYLEANFINANERQENLVELISFASSFEALPELLERFSLLQATDDASTADQKQALSADQPVHLSTVHLAKGLEFDTVFVAGAAEGLMPHIRSIDNENSLEEERRLMYVAMTRARKNLFLSFFGLPSRFIAEIPNEHVRFAENTGEETSGSRDDYTLESYDDYS